MGQNLLQSGAGVKIGANLLQSGAGITKWDNYYKVGTTSFIR